MNQIYFRNASFVVTMDNNSTVYSNGDVLIQDDKILAVGKIDPALIHDDAQKINAREMIIMPGLVNTHVHTSQQLERGLGDDVGLLTWLSERTFPYESSLTEEDSYISTLLCMVEQIRSGVTAFTEAGGQFVGSMAKAVTEAGIRGTLSKSAMDCGEGLPSIWKRTTQEELDAQEENVRKYDNTANSRIRVWFALRTLFNDSDELVVRTKELTDKYKVGYTMHVAEAKDEVEFVRKMKGVPTVTHLHNLGVLDKNLLAVHTVWLTNEEIDLFKEYDVKVSHNPVSAMRVLGFAKIPQMLDKGVCVSIGTDGAASSNRMTMIDEMWVTSIIHKGWRLDPTVMKAEQILKMATIDGARAMLSDKLYGSIEPGKKADIIMIDPNDAMMLPMHDPIANLVTAMRNSNVKSVICDGKWIMKDGVILTLDEKNILQEAKAHADAIRERAGIKLRDRFPIVKC